MAQPGRGAAARSPTSTDPVERIAFASEVFLRRVLAYQGSVRAMIAATITRPGGRRHAAGPPVRLDRCMRLRRRRPRSRRDADAFARLKRDLAVVVSPEALFTLTDLCGLSPDDAIASAVRLATTITATALRGAPDHL